jgi:hypothetical protein
LELLKAGLLPIDIKFTDRQRYYRCFREPGGMQELIAEYEEKELEHYIGMFSQKAR